MRDKIAKAMMVIAAAGVFFALVCPLAATPMPVGKVKRLADAAAPSPTPLPIIVFQISTQPAVPPLLETALIPFDVSDLSCVLTC